MEITAALVLKIAGGIIVAGAHRTIARVAKQESTGWWLTAMFVPGGSIFYGLRRAQECIGLVLMMGAGFVILGSGVGLQIYQAVRETKTTAAAAPTLESYATEVGEDEPDEPTEIPATPIAMNTPAAQSPALPAASSVPRRLQPKLQKLTARYEKLAADRARLNVNDEDAVRSFNLRAEDYQAACRQFRAELAD